jgi:amino acid adenylation domain-containing protein
MSEVITRTGASPVQHGVWITERVGAAGSAYAMPVLLRFEGEPRVDALRAACAAVVGRHPLLASVAEERDGELFLVPAAAPPTLSVVDVTGSSDSALDKHVGDEVRRPFDLTEGPLIRFTLFELAPARHLLLIVAHHLVFDGTSKDLLVSDLAASYDAARAGEVEPAGPAADGPLVDEAPDEGARAAAAAYYAGRWADPAEVVLPGLGRWSRSAQPGEELRFDLDAPLRADLAGAADRLGVTRFEFLVALVQTLLRRYGNQDVTIGVDLGTRNDRTRDLIGLFVNELPVLAAPAAGASFAEFATAVRAELRELYRHRGVPLGQAVAGLTPRVGITPVTFSYRRRAGVERAFTGLRTAVEWMAPNHASRNALHIQVVEGPERTSVSLQYAPAALDRGDVGRIAGHLRTLLREVVDHPDVPLSRAALLPPAERTMLGGCNDTTVDYPANATLPKLFGAQAAVTPRATAVVASQRRLTYAELDGAATRLARRLRQRGIGPGSLVGVCAPRSADQLVALLGVARAGAAYLPLDPGYPAERLDHVLADAGVDLVLTAGPVPAAVTGATLAVEGVAAETVGETVDEEPGEELPTPAAADLAYVLYTSGSTGRPKGVEVEHGALANLLLGMRDLLGSTAEDRWLALTSLSFDIAALELFLPLITGGSVVLAPESSARDGDALAALIEAERITHVQATPSGWRVLLAAGAPPRLTVALVGGEALPLPLAQRLRERASRLVNVYGPTETTIWSTAADIPRAPQTITIGRPIANTRVYVVDPELEPLPVGVPGELVIGGRGLARGYRGQPELTEARFVRDPYAPPGGRLYRTGDRARRTADGDLEFLGRTDDQVKIRGHRIELAEIESRLAAHPGVAAAAVAVRGDEAGEPVLVGYVVGRGGTPPAAAELREHAGRWLPAALVPGPIVPLDALPLTPNGKLDRAALPEPAHHAEPAPAEQAETELARAVREIWQDVLRIDEIGPDEDLFDLGGHSLTMIRITARIKRGYGVEVPLDVFFDAPTITGVVTAVESLLAGRK